MHKNHTFSLHKETSMNFQSTETGLTPMPIIRMEKSSLRTIIGKILSYSSPAKKQVIRSASCLSCPEGSRYQKLAEECRMLMSGNRPDITEIKKTKGQMDSIDHMCAASGCSKCQVKTIYQNDKKDFHLYGSSNASFYHRMPKNAVRLFLLLYSLPQSLLGDTHFIRNLSAAKAAEYLSCTVSTVKRSMEALEASGYITFSHAADLSHFNIILTHYDTMHLPAAKGGSGYLSFERNTLDSLLAIKNVNQLRFELLCLLRYDNAQCTSPEDEIPVWENYSFHDLKNMLPSHMNYRAKFEHMSGSPDTLFYHYISGKRIYFSLKEEFSLRFDYGKLASANCVCLRECFKEIGLSIQEEDLLSLSKMATQFDISLILQCTSEILKQRRFGPDIRNLPGLVRRLCQNLALGNSAAI